MFGEIYDLVYSSFEEMVAYLNQNHFASFSLFDLRLSVFNSGELWF